MLLTIIAVTLLETSQLLPKVKTDPALVFPQPPDEEEEEEDDDEEDEEEDAPPQGLL